MDRAVPARTILVADDDSAVLSFLAALLGARKFTVITARDGAEALTIAQTYAREQAKSIDLLITDFEMPHRNGLELAAEMRLLFPDIGTVLISGRPGCEPAIRQPGLRFLKKPFGPSVLLETVASLLRSRC